MTYRRQLGRYSFLVLVLVALAAGTTTATRWMPWSPLSSCLFCGGSNAGAPAGPEDQPRAASTTGMLAGRLGHSVNQPDVDLVPSPIAAQTAPRSAELSARATASSDGWQPWGNAAPLRIGGGDNAVLLGGLSRLASTSISGGASAARAPVATPAPAALAEHAEKPLPSVETPAPPPHPAPTPPTAHTPTPATQPVIPPTAAPLPPGPGGSTLPPQPPLAAPTGAPQPTVPFVEHTTPPPTPFVPPAPAGAIEPNGPSGTLPGDGAPSPTPEPASMILLATGVAVVIGELRRRRAM